MNIFSKIKKEDLVMPGITIVAIAAGAMFFMLRPARTKESPRDDVNLGTNLVNSKELYYVKDYRTDLCFATRKFGWEDGLLSNVPCTPKVEENLINRLP